MRTVLPRNARIDLLRGIAVSLVMLLHYSLTYRLPDSWLGDVLTPKWVARLVMNGNYGVTMFFVISGYLITTNSLRRWGALQDLDRWAFYRRRALRILPPLLPALLTIAVLGLLEQPSFVNKQKGELMDPGFWVLALGSALTFWHNVLMQFEGYFNYALNIYWSLSVEEFFYLAFPMVCVLLPKRLFALTCAVLVVVGPVYRAMHVERELDYLYAYLACFDAIAIGCLTALIAPRVKLPVMGSTVITILAACALATVYLQGIGGHEVFGFTGIALCTAILIGFDVHRTQRLRTFGMGRVIHAPLHAMRWLGRHSYELYLFHIIVLGIMRDQLGRDDLERAWKLPWMVVFFAVSALVAYAVGRWARRWT